MSPPVIEDENPNASPAESGLRDSQSSETAKFVWATFKFGGMALLVLVVLQALNIVGFTYRSPVDNQPLTNPVAVLRNDEKKEEVELADGRIITRYWYYDRLADVMKRTGCNEIEIAPSDLGPDKVEVASKDYHFFCGIGDPMFTIPLIPMRVPRYKRVVVGYGDRPQTSPVSLTSTP